MAFSFAALYKKVNTSVENGSDAGWGYVKLVYRSKRYRDSRKQNASVESLIMRLYIIAR